MAADTPSPRIEVRDWPEAPEGTTHALLRPNSRICYMRIGTGRDPVHWWRKNWVTDPHDSSYWLNDPHLVPKVYEVTDPA